MSLVIILLELTPDISRGLLLSGKEAAMAQKDADLQKIKELIEIMKQNGLVEIEIKHGDDKIFLKCAQPQSMMGPGISAGAHGPVGAFNSTAAGESTSRAAVPPTLPLVSAPQAGEELVEIKSPLVGTFYATPSPDSEPYVEIGSQVDPQTVVCIVEAMKVMNEIKAETSGTIAEILVENGQAVEYGQVLFKVRPD